MRELQGEEGLLGIVKGGNKYQLISLEISPKRIPRTHLNGADWGTLLERYGNVCAACGRSPSQKGFQQDHKIPRLRGGGDEFDNWQPLCDECNNFKSTACRDCQLDCKKCCWAFPEKYKPLHISGELIAQLYEAAHKLNQNPNSIVERMIELWIKEQQGDASIK